MGRPTGDGQPGTANRGRPTGDGQPGTANRGRPTGDGQPGTANQGRPTRDGQPEAAPGDCQRLPARRGPIWWPPYLTWARSPRRATSATMAPAWHS
ncbi:hypothetical protein CV751_15065 [Achromobacter ruhlandii]|nr:hypothetical protein CV751_15065 [Achromobacter ruhlandii]